MYLSTTIKDISDSYCSLNPLWLGMEEVVPVRTSLTIHPPSPPTVLQFDLCYNQMCSNYRINFIVFMRFCFPPGIQENSCVAWCNKVPVQDLMLGFVR